MLASPTERPTPITKTAYLDTHKALENQLLRSKDPSPYIFIKTGYEEEKVKLDDILYIEADGNYLTYVLNGRKLLSRQNMMDALNLLPASQFIRVHRSYIIASAAIQKISRFEIVVGEKTIPVGVSYEDRIVDLRARLKK